MGGGKWGGGKGKMRRELQKGRKEGEGSVRRGNGGEKKVCEGINGGGEGGTLREQRTGNRIKEKRKVTKRRGKTPRLEVRKGGKRRKKPKGGWKEGMSTGKAK